MSADLGARFGPVPSEVPWPCRPGLRRGAAPERPSGATSRTALDSLVARALAALGNARRGRLAAIRSAAIAQRAAELKALPVTEASAGFERLRVMLLRRGHDEMSLTEAFAHAALAAERVLGLTPHDGQRRAAEALLRGCFVEMPTGEGKTLATALAAAVAALDGTPVHVLTANDYLAARDAARLAPLYASLGLSSACALPSMDERARRAAYASDVVHVTGKQLGFDWMRDALCDGADANSLVARLGTLTRPDGHRTPRSGRVRAGAPLLRGLCLGIVDEADSLLIDEARTPLVLAAPRDGGEVAERESIVALALARMLDEGIDFHLSPERREAALSERGVETLARLAERIPGVWQATRYRDERVRQALAALHLWHRDRDYIVRDGALELVDEHSGRTLSDRRLQHGLHVLLELKECCKPTIDSDVIASIACQRLFQRYARLVGTSGTLSEVRGELTRVYGATLVRVSHERSPRRVTLPPRAFASRSSQLDALIEELHGCATAGRPVLIGTRSVEQSSGVSALLAAHGISHRVLNACQDAEEAAIVAEAGQPGRVTVATNMAGRGTDIPLGEGVIGRGGLHVVSLAFNDARRIDRQLAGRAARQGEPGSFRQLWTLDDPALSGVVPDALLTLARHLLGGTRWRASGSAFALVLVRLAQHRVERRHARRRRLALESRERIAQHVAIGSSIDHPA